MCTSKWADGRVVMALRLGLDSSRSSQRSVVRKSVGVSFLALSKLLWVYRLTCG